MKRFLIGIFLTLPPLWANAAELTDMTQLEFKGHQLRVYRGHCAAGNFTVQKVSRGYQFIGPMGKGMARTPEKAVAQACGEMELDC
jgi:hypothetical protein